MTVALDEDLFARTVEPLRGELTAHCYRMMGSVHEAEDLVQETYLRAWKAFEKFEQRSSVRTWMYRIATNTCLTALEGRGRRPMPVGLGQPASDPHAGLQPDYEVPWLEPLPDAVVWGGPEVDPAAAVVDRESVRLAFVAALQHLTPAQRAVLILRDVLAWQASEVGELLEMSVAAVNSSLQRARATVHQLDPESQSADLDEDRAKELLADYVTAFEQYDVSRIVELLAEDAVWEMPPYLGWYRGSEAIGEVIRRNCPAEGPGDQVLLPTQANGQPAFGLYMRQPDGHYAAFQLQVLTLDGDRVGHVSVFFDLRLFERFGLPATVERA
ncbi:MAG TPA: sigma-70 family RNA polymerase sigma factor [Propionibacteriaceae bacterium]|nr:sigma-70 family RNA polymerase sigma factor [Propionibacteriaceae bacterium]